MKIALFDEEFLHEYSVQICKLVLAIRKQMGIELTEPWLPNHIYEQLMAQGYGTPDCIPNWKLALDNVKDKQSIFGVERNVSEWAEYERNRLRTLIAENEGKRQIPADIYDKWDKLMEKYEEWREDWIAPDPLAEF